MCIDHVNVLADAPQADAPQAEKKAKTNHPRRSVEIMKDFFGSELEKKEEAAERRHKEKLQTVNSLIDVLKKVADK